MASQAFVPVSLSLLELPANALQRIVLYLPDPGALAAVCRTAAALLRQDPVLLAWASAWLPLPEVVPGSKQRHSEYLLLGWRRLQRQDTVQLAVLLFWWVQRQSTVAPGLLQHVQQLLGSGRGLAALQALLPHPEHLLMQYAAQAGQTQLLKDLLAQPEMQRVRLQWDAEVHAHCQLLLPAVFAAVRGGHREAMHMLLAAVAANSLRRPQQLGNLHAALLAVAIGGGSRCARCAAALLHLCPPEALKAHVSQHFRLPAVQKLDDPGLISDIVHAVAAACGPYRAYELAICSGQLQLLPALSVGLQIFQPAQWTCVSARQLIQIGGVSELQHLAQGMVGLGQGPVGNHYRNAVLLEALLANSTAALEAIWVAFATSSEHRAALLDILLDKLGFQAESAHLQLETVHWVVDKVLLVMPSLLSQHARDSMLTEACLRLMRCGRPDCQPACQQLRLLISGQSQQPDEHLRWQRAQREGQLLSAARRGDAAAVAQALALGGYAGAVGDLPLQREALGAAIQLPDAAVAEAVVRELVPMLGDGEELLDIIAAGVLQAPLCAAHGGRLLHVLCDALPVFHAGLAGPRSLPDLFWRACEQGAVDAAEWLVRHPDQRSTYLADVCMDYSIDQQVDVGNAWEFAFKLSSGNEHLPATFIQLLHRLATDNGSGPPAGARQLTDRFLLDMAYSGMPDMLHALLVFIDKWSLCSQPSAASG